MSLPFKGQVESMDFLLGMAGGGLMSQLSGTGMCVTHPMCPCPNLLRGQRGSLS